MNDEKYVIRGELDVTNPEDLCFSKFTIDGLKKGGDRIALVDGITGQTITYREILQRSVNLAISLKTLGIRKSDVVSISSENRLEFIITAFAVIFIGGVVAPLNITYTSHELEHLLNLSKPRFIFCSPTTLQNIQNVIKTLQYVEKLLVYGNEAVANVIMFNDLVNRNENINTFQPTKVDPVKDHLTILTSSGTTGLPKGVMLTHKNFIICSQHLDISFMSTNPRKEEISVLSVVPWFHAYGFLTSTNLIATRFKLVFAIKFEEKLYLKILEEQKITMALTVPPLVIFLAKHPLVSQYNLSSLREIWCGAAPLSKEIQDGVTKRLNLKFITQAYGMTETTLAVLRDSSNGAKTGSAGQVVQGTQVKVVDLLTGEALGPYDKGELCFKGPLMMKGYVGSAALTENIYDDKGWLHTGDIGYYDSDKFFYIVDRIKELIKYKGYQVAPAELEAILLQHPSVIDVGVVGLPDETAGELPLAFVTKQPNSTVTKEELIEYVAGKVSPAKRLRGGIIFIEQIPKNPAGKILRRELKKLLNNNAFSKL